MRPKKTCYCCCCCFRRWWLGWIGSNVLGWVEVGLKWGKVRICAGGVCFVCVLRLFLHLQEAEELEADAERALLFGLFCLCVGRVGTESLDRSTDESIFTDSRQQPHEATTTTKKLDRSEATSQYIDNHHNTTAINTHLGDVVGEDGVVHEVDAEGEGVERGPPPRGQELLDQPALLVWFDWYFRACVRLNGFLGAYRVCVVCRVIP